MGKHLPIDRAPLTIDEEVAFIGYISGTKSHGKGGQIEIVVNRSYLDKLVYLGALIGLPLVITITPWEPGDDGESTTN